MLHILADSVFEVTRTAAFRYGRKPADWRTGPAPTAPDRRSLPRAIKTWLRLRRSSGAD